MNFNRTVLKAYINIYMRSPVLCAGKICRISILLFNKFKFISNLFVQ